MPARLLRSAPLGGTRQRLPLTVVRYISHHLTKGPWGPVNPLFRHQTHPAVMISPGGKTPHATLYTAILRDMKLGDDSRFVKAERGNFAVRG